MSVMFLPKECRCASVYFMPLSSTIDELQLQGAQKLLEVQERLRILRGVCSSAEHDEVLGGAPCTRQTAGSWRCYEKWRSSWPKMWKI